MPTIQQTNHWSHIINLFADAAKAKGLISVPHTAAEYQAAGVQPPLYFLWDNPTGRTARYRWEAWRDGDRTHITLHRRGQAGANYSI
ncbi:MAG: hypothetical protein KIT87_26950 [Anaerolineae bacterium]|nr:hypothetical protein [Anaerolineae bacterium]